MFSQNYTLLYNHHANINGTDMGFFKKYLTYFEDPETMLRCQQQINTTRRAKIKKFYTLLAKQNDYFKK